MSERVWHEPKVSTIRLLNGETAEAEVNGITPDGQRGMAYVNGREVKVMRYKGEWSEDPFIEVDDLS